MHTNPNTEVNEELAIASHEIPPIQEKTFNRRSATRKDRKLLDHYKSMRNTPNKSVGADFLSVYLQKDLKPTEIVHNAQNPGKVSSKISTHGARCNVSQLF